jgi:5'(3')-deoxyribonucleotidase
MMLERDQLKVYKITFNYSKNIIPENEWYQVTDDIFTTPGFWEHIPLWKDAAKVVALLIEQHEVYILTKPWVNYEKSILEKMSWIRQYLPFFNTEHVIFTGQKHLLKGDYIIDDAPQYLELPGLKTIAMDYPYNKQYKVDLRVKTWEQIGKYFEVL